MTEPSDPRRRIDIHAAPEARNDEFAEAVREGLTAARKSLPCRFIYDREGSELFDEICELPEYYLTRTEAAILNDRREEIVGALPESVTLVELGSGSGEKTRILIEALLEDAGRLRYVPIDVSRSAVEESTKSLVEDYDGLFVHGIVAEYRPGLERLAAHDETPRLILWLGSSVGNFSRADAASFLRHVTRSMGSEDRLLVGIDLRKDPAVLERAYNDSRGVTARFNRNILVRINRELGGGFDVESFRHHAPYNHDEGRIEMHLVSTRPQRVRIGALDLEVGFDEGETIHTENSHKFSTEEIDELARRSGLTLAAQWFDERRYFSVNLLAIE